MYFVPTSLSFFSFFLFVSTNYLLWLAVGKIVKVVGGGVVVQVVAAIKRGVDSSGGIASFEKTYWFNYYMII